MGVCLPLAVDLVLRTVSLNVLFWEAVPVS